MSLTPVTVHAGSVPKMFAGRLFLKEKSILPAELLLHHSLSPLGGSSRLGEPRSSSARRRKGSVWRSVSAKRWFGPDNINEVNRVQVTRMHMNMNLNLNMVKYVKGRRNVSVEEAKRRAALKGHSSPHQLARAC